MGVRALIGQFLKFGVVGALATLIDYGILMVLSQVAGWDPLPASAVSFTVSLVFNYVASMRFVFERRDDLSRRRELAIFVALSLVGLAINSALMWAGTDGLELDYRLVKVAATAIVTTYNFVTRKIFLDGTNK